MIVVDALDEYIRDEDTSRILGLFATTKAIPNISLKVFLISRPETEISHRFGKMLKTDYDDCILYNIEELIVEHDIAVFLKHHLGRIRDHHQYLSSQWPESRDVESLVKKARRLFIYAATTCRYIGDENFDPEERLRQLLTSAVTSKLATQDLDSIYLAIVENSVIMISD